MLLLGGRTLRILKPIGHVARFVWVVGADPCWCQQRKVGFTGRDCHCGNLYVDGRSARREPTAASGFLGLYAERLSLPYRRSILEPRICGGGAAFAAPHSLRAIRATHELDMFVGAGSKCASICRLIYSQGAAPYGLLQVDGGSTKCEFLRNPTQSGQ